jgi:hypothetical protein
MKIGLICNGSACGDRSDYGDAVSGTAAVVLDDWKLPVFKRHLDAAGYKYEEPVPFTEGTLTLKVRYEWVHELQPIIEAAQRESAGMQRASPTRPPPAVS